MHFEGGEHRYYHVQETKAGGRFHKIAELVNQICAICIMFGEMSLLVMKDQHNVLERMGGGIDSVIKSYFPQKMDTHRVNVQDFFGLSVGVNLLSKNAVEAVPTTVPSRVAEYEVLLCIADAYACCGVSITNYGDFGRVFQRKRYVPSKNDFEQWLIRFSLEIAAGELVRRMRCECNFQVVHC